MKNRFILVLFILFFGNFYPQQTDSVAAVQELKYDEQKNLAPVKFNEEALEAYKEKKEFDYIRASEKDNWWIRFKKWINAKYNQFINWLFGDYDPGSFLSFIIKIIPYLLLLLLLGIVAWLFTRLNPGARMLETPGQGDVFLSEEEELIKNEDLVSLLKKAVEEGRFRLAVRYYYLNELRKLDELKLIDYQYQKTNKEYLEEIKSSDIQKKFAEITKLYEFIWYGNFLVTETDFKLAEKGFLRMDDILKSVRNE